MNEIALKAKTKKKRRLGKEDRVLHTIVTVMMILLLIIILYPLIYVVSSSFSSGQAVSSGKVLLWPVEPSVTGYKLVFAYKQVWTGYANTIFYTVVGTALNVCLTTLTAYALSRRTLQWRKFYTTLFMIPMFFTGGIIPNYILMTNLGLVNTRWALIFSGAINVYNMIIMRTYFQNSIPDELLEAAKIDGISDIGYLFRIVIPLSKAIFAVITLYYAVAHWNSYFNAMLYLRDRSLYPLQLVLREILNASTLDLSQITDPEALRQLIGASDLMKYSLIIVSSLPIIMIYPFVQRFFEKGVMIGSVKG